jgi:hypothetical protein
MANAVTNISDLQDLVVQTGQGFAQDIVAFVPALIYAIIIFLLGWIIALIISRIFGRILKLIKFEHFLKEQKVNEALGSVVISTILTKILYYYIIVIFVRVSLNFLNLGSISDFVGEIIAYLPALIGGALLVVAAALIGEFIKRRIIEVGKKSSTMNFIGRATKAIIVFMAVISALKTIGIWTSIFETTFVSFSTAIFFGIALAFAIAFGLGAQGEAKEVVKGFRKKFQV